MGKPKKAKVEKYPPCPECKTGLLKVCGQAFENTCSVCWKVFPKQCPCYFEPKLCEGCGYFKLCQSRPLPSGKLKMDKEPLC